MSRSPSPHRWRDGSVELCGERSLAVGAGPCVPKTLAVPHAHPALSAGSPRATSGLSRRCQPAQVDRRRTGRWTDPLVRMATHPDQAVSWGHDPEGAARPSRVGTEDMDLSPAREVQEDERHQLARERHDEIGVSLRPLSRTCGPEAPHRLDSVVADAKEAAGGALSGRQGRVTIRQVVGEPGPFATSALS